MSGTSSHGRVRISDLLLIAAVNGVLGTILFGALIVLFGIHGTLGGPAGTGPLQGRWELLASVPFISAAAFAGLWMKLCMQPRGLPVGSGGFYGVALSYGTFPLAGAAAGVLNGIGTERWIIYLVSLLVMPDLLAAVTIYGVLMGLANAWLAYRWRAYYGRQR